MAEIPLNTKPYYSTDPIASDVSAEGLWDAAMDKLPNGRMVTRKRPGLSTYANVQGTNGGTGIYYCDRLNAVFFVCGGILYKMSYGSKVVSSLGGNFSLTNMVEFAEGQDLDSTPVIYMADGGPLKYTKGTTVKEVNPAPRVVTFTDATEIVNLNSHGYTTGDAVFFRSAGSTPTNIVQDTVYYVIYVTVNTFQISTTYNGSALAFTGTGSGTQRVYPGDFSAAPTASTSVVWFNNRFVCNEVDTGFFYATGVNINLGSSKFGEFDNYFWDSIFNPFIAEAKGDYVSKLISANQELLVWGGEGLECWQDDGVSPFSNVPQGFKEVGLMAPESVVTVNGVTFALGNFQGRRDIVKMVSRQFVPIGEDIRKVINDYTTVADAIGMYVAAQGMEFYVIQFPTENATWAYDLNLDYWAKWGAWSLGQGQYDQFRGRTCCYARQWGKSLMQAASGGAVYEVDRAFFSDAGNLIRSARRTGWIDWDTFFRRKRSDQIFIKVKTLQFDGTPTLLMRWRNDGRQEWSNYMELPLYPSGQQDCLVKLNRFGQYRSRQYEFVLSDTADLLLCEMQEEYEMMRN